jgi:iron complex transport system substrate-binding protein
MRRLSVLMLAAAVASSAAGAAAQAASSGNSIRYAKGFSIERKEGYTLLRVMRPWPGASGGFTYVLYGRGSPRPAGVKADGFFETPIRRAVTFSTTYIPQIVALGEVGSLVGVDSKAYVSTPEARARIASGAIAEVAKDWAPNIELLISLAPDAVFTYGMGNEWDIHPKLAEAGLPIIISGEWNEADPLGRAEWMKFIAAFYGKEAEAAAYFDRVAAEYERVRDRMAALSYAPSVLVNGPFQGSWTVSGGDSYMARLVSDAGGRYLWSDDRGTGGLTLSVEAVYARALKADFWLNPGAGVSSVKDLRALDPRFAALPCVTSRNVWNNTLRATASGGNDYYEGAVLNPDKVLADLAAILHPGVLPDRPFAYYRRISE